MDCKHTKVRSEVGKMILYYCCKCGDLVGGSRLGMDVTKPVDYSSFGGYRKNK